MGDRPLRQGGVGVGREHENGQFREASFSKRVEDAGAAAVAVHGRTAAQSYKGESDWRLIDSVARSVTIPVFGSGDCVEADQVVSRLRDSAVAGVLVGRGALRNPWIFRQAADLVRDPDATALVLSVLG